MSTPATFDEWWEKSGRHYEAAVIAGGGTPWTDDIEERRYFWERRYTRPDPPAGLMIDPRKPESYTVETPA